MIEGKVSIEEVEAAIDAGKHVNIAPDGTVTVSDRKPHPTIDRVLAEIGDEHNRAIPTPEDKGIEVANNVFQTVKAGTKADISLWRRVSDESEKAIRQAEKDARLDEHGRICDDCEPNRPCDRRKQLEEKK